MSGGQSTLGVCFWGTINRGDNLHCTMTPQQFNFPPAANWAELANRMNFVTYVIFARLRHNFIKNGYSTAWKGVRVWLMLMV